MATSELYSDTSEQTPEQETCARWLKEIARAEKHRDEWKLRGEKLLKLYRKQGKTDKGPRQFAMLWANTEVMKPSVYARPPIAQVSRRFKDRDPVGRMASELLERNASYELERMNIDATLKNCRDDLLLPGRGTAWVRYEADTSEGGTAGVTAERVQADYVHWKCFLHSPARTWDEVTWVAREGYFTKDELKSRFGSKSSDVELDHKAKNDSGTEELNPQKGGEAKATVYELWDKTSKKVYFIAKGGKECLEETDPFLDLTDFWPCPKPIFSTLTTDTLIPIPDYAYYQDQAEEIDSLTARIGHLTDQLKLVSFYPAGDKNAAALEKAMDPNTENAAIPIESWAMFSEKGGASGSIIFLPIKDVAACLKECVALRNQLVQDVYQITGLSDIQRGQTDPNETAAAQELKAQWGSIRIRERQKEMARFARDIVRITCEIMAERFEPMRLAETANMVPQQPQPPPQQPPAPPQMDPATGQPIPPPPDPAMEQFKAALAKFQQETQQLEASLKLLKDQRLRSFRIDIETDSTIEPDENAEKQRRVEFVTAIGGFMKEAFPLAAAAPPMIPVISETLMFMVRGFRAGRMMEEVIEKAADQMQQQAAQAQGQGQTDPKVELEKARMEVIDKPKNDAEIQKLGVETQILQAQAAVAPQKAQLEMDGQSAEIQRGDGELELKKGQATKDNEFRDGEAQFERGQAQDEAAGKMLGTDKPASANGKAQPNGGPIMQLLQGLTMGLQQLAQGQAQMAQALMAPKHVIRDENGQVAGVETVRTVN